MKVLVLADDVMVEQDTNAGKLVPQTGTVGDALGAGSAEGFTPNGIPADVSADPVMEPPGGTNFADSEGGPVSGAEPGTEGGTTAGMGVNGSRAKLPYNLDPATTPVLGSWRPGVQIPARMRSGWYRLPQRDQAGPLLVVAAAGRFNQGEVRVEYANDAQAAADKIAGAVGFADVGAAPAWRNLRAPMAAIPRDATLIRIVATDDDLAPQHWIALTPPRVPKLRTLQDVVGSKDPVMLDWLVGLAFPCQRPFGHDNGVTEVPKWRILPDRFGAEANSPVMDYLGGGPLGVAVHPSPGWTGPTVVGHLAGAGFRIATSGASERQGIVQRLDVGTSGLMVVAKSERAYTVLKRAFKHRTVEKRYHALVQGHPDPSSGTIDAPIGRARGNDWKFAVTEGGRHSVTHYDTIEAFVAASLLDVHLETGRTHQIRVHFSALHHPCCGDLTYGADPTLAKKLGIDRQWLHARSLGFAHPADGRWVEITSEYPAELQHALDVLHRQ